MNNTCILLILLLLFIWLIYKTTEKYINKSPTIHLITYANNRYRKSKERLRKEAEHVNWFDTITLYGPEDLDDDFKERFKDTLDQSKGGGYWIWKPYIIKQKLDNINDNDILVYLDAGCQLNPQGKGMFDEYISLLDTKGEMISFQLEQLEKEYTTKEVFDYFNVSHNGEIANSGQLVGGIQLIRRSQDTIQLIDEWLDTLYNNENLFTNYYNKNQETYFKDNRHDQSVFSIIRKLKANHIVIPDQTYFSNYGSEESLKYPFWARRL